MTYLYVCFIFTASAEPFILLAVVLKRKKYYVYLIFFSLKCQISLTHFTTLRLNDTPTGGAMEKEIFFKFKEKLHSTIFIQ